MKLKKNLITAALAVPALFVVPSLQAAAITGMANIAGNVSVSASSINFDPTFSNGGVGSMQTGSFAGLTGGTIQSLTGGATTGNVNRPGFAVFTTGVSAPITFDLTFIAPGVGTLAGCSNNALGSECTPTGSPFTLFQISSNTVLASLQLNGTGYTGSAATGTSSVTSIFSTQTALNGTITSIYNTLVSGGTLTGITYSASFVATSSPAVPEPASLLLVGGALIGAGLFARRRAAN